MSALMLSGDAQAFTPSAAQIEQFKKLPRAQQEALAKQYGVDISAITGSSSKQSTQEAEPTISERKSNESSDELDSLDPEKKYQPKKQELEAFGYDLFAGEPSTFNPSERAPVPESYTIGPGDEVQVTLFGKENESHSLVVDRSGRLAIPNLSPVNVAGMSLGELKQFVKNKIENEMIGVNAFVALGELRSIRVLIVGEAYKPGSYSLSALSTVTHALFASGGVTDIASLRNIQVKRGGKVVSTFDLYSLLLKGDSAGDITLKPGDVVFIPPVGMQVSVDGAVKRPAIFELKKGESAQQLLAMAGGLAADAYAKRATVVRAKGGDTKQVLSLDLTQNTQNFKLKDGDAITIDQVASAVDNNITLIGAVTRPGDYQWHQGKRLTDVIDSVRGALLPQADLNYALVVRERDIFGAVDVVQVSLADALKGGRDDIALQARDKIFVFSRYQTIEAEEQALKDLALTEDEQKQQEKVKLWHLFQQRKFEEFVGVNQTQNNEEDEKAASNDLTLLLNQTEEDEDNTQYAVFSRKSLLAPIQKQLAYQANKKEPIQLVEVNGKVRYPGVYPLANDMDVRKLVVAAGGLLESAYIEKAELTRAQSRGRADIEHISFDLGSALYGEQEQRITLESKDNVNILTIPEWQEDIKVTIQGEVNFPGTYTIRRGESMASVLKRAGGLTNFASAEAAVFTRESIQRQEQIQLERLANELRRDMASKSFESSINSSNLSYDEMTKLIDDLSSVQSIGRLVIDLPNIIGGQQNLTLQNGDRLLVPTQRQSVSVIGEVNYSSSHLYKDGIDVEQYITMSGGMKQRADDERIYIIKANGAVQMPKKKGWFASRSSTKVEPGDTIVVPLDSSHMDNLTLWSTATQIFYQIGVGIAAIGGI